MKKIKVAICDEERLYIESLAAYLVERKDPLIEYSFYTNPEELTVERMEEQDILLMGQQFWEIMLEHVPMQILAIYLSEGEVLDVHAAYPVILKIQQADQIIREILYFWQSKQDSRETWKIFGKSSELIGVYSPGKVELQMFFSMLLASELAKTRKVLYLSLLEWSGFADVFQEEWQYDLSDLLLMMQHRDGCFRQQLASVVHQIGGVDYVRPMYHPENRDEVSAEDYSNLIRHIREETEYEAVILDFGHVMHGFYEIAGQCELLYCLTRDNPYSNRSTEQFMQQMEPGSDLRERVQVIQIPQMFHSGLLKPGEELLEQLQCGEFGDLVRTYGCADASGEGRNYD